MPFKKSDPHSPRQSGDVQRIFVGRADQIHFFIHSILEPEDPSHNIISIAGQGGVGKSTLVQYLIDEAQAIRLRDYCLTAKVDERQTTPANVMERFADQLRELGLPLKKFEQALTSYKEALRRIRIGYRDEQEVLVREVIDVAGAVTEELPFIGGVVHKGVNVLAETLIEKEHTRRFLKDAARLENPVGDLTKAFVKDLNQIADTLVTVRGARTKRPRRVLLFFDTFEQLAADIAPWLLDHFLEADISTNVVLVIAGRESIETSMPDDPKRWLPFLDNGNIHRISLDSFTEEETQIYLRERGITDPERVKEIRQLSHGLPLYLSMLTSDLQGKIDPTAEVVENFLRWLPKGDHLTRRLALDAALFSRPFNQDDLAAFAYLGQERSALYRWIIGQPFVQSNPQDGRHSYHDLARELFSRHLYQRSSEEYYATRRALAAYYQKQSDKMQTEWGRSAYTSPHWRKLEIALIQQLFLLPDEASHIKGIEHVLLVFRHTMQTEEFTRVLRIIASKESGNLALPSAQQITEKIVLYMEEDAYDTYQER